MIILFIFTLCLVVYFGALASVSVQIFPEFFFYPRLVAKGLIQYKDFFDHHGFFTNLLLASVAHNPSILSSIFIATQLIQFAAIAYLVSKKVKHPLTYSLILIFYLSFQFGVIQQQMWFDAWMAFFLVLAWLSFEKKWEILGWLFIACATMIKPTAALFLIPFFLRSRRKKTILMFFTVWLVVIFYFFSRGAVGKMWDELIVFNYSYIQSTYKTFFLGIPFKLLMIIAGGFLVLLWFSMKQKSKNTPLILMAVISFSFFAQGLSKLNLALFVPFCILLISEIFKRQKVNKVALVVLSVFTLVMIRDAYKTYLDCQKRQIYLSSAVLQEVKQVSSFITEKKEKNVLVVGNRVEIYYLLDILPPEFIPLHFPWVEKVYGRNTNLKGIQYIVVPKKFGEYESLDMTVKSALQKDFKQVGQTASYTIWRYNKG